MTGTGAPPGGSDGSVPPDQAPTTSAPTPPTGTPGVRRRFPVVASIALLAAAVVLLGGPLTEAPPTPTPSAEPVGSGGITPSPVPSATATAPATPPPATPSPSLPSVVSRGYLADRADLIERAARARSGEQPYAAALDDLLLWAHGAARRDPKPATRLRIRGTEGPFVDDTAAAYGLAVAFVMTGDGRYGEAAAKYVMAWVDKTTSTRDTCPDDGSCQTSLIISRTVPGFVFAADLLAGSGFIDGEEEGRLRSWLRDLMLPTASELDNNWGDAGTFTRVVLTDYLGDQAGFDAAIDKWRSMLDLVGGDGHIPAEVARGRAGIGYTQEALDYKVAVAVIAERRGIDLWSAVGDRGGTLKGAVDHLARGMTRPSRWPWYDNVSRPGPSAFWELAYAQWPEGAYAPIVLERRPHGVLGHSAVRWTTATNGVPIARR
jgi:hypothetical protein